MIFITLFKYVSSQKMVSDIEVTIIRAYSRKMNKVRNFIHHSEEHLNQETGN